mmetsp:Transcript_13392/g.19133  ORF Transcript_13392/g.19133 Transcript_13392/m.19133 type:complete len:98 (+) Transcript_13392:179-472(+)
MVSLQTLLRDRRGVQFVGCRRRISTLTKNMACRPKKMEFHPLCHARSREEKNIVIVFCPLADDHEIYYEHQRLRQGKKMHRNKRHDAENYKRGSTSM